MGGKKSKVCTTAKSSVSLYTAPSSELSKPTIKFGSIFFGSLLKTEERAPAPSLAVHPPPLQKTISSDMRNNFLPFLLNFINVPYPGFN